MPWGPWTAYSDTIELTGSSVSNNNGYISDDVVRGEAGAAYPDSGISGPITANHWASIQTGIALGNVEGVSGAIREVNAIYPQYGAKEQRQQAVYAYFWDVNDPINWMPQPPGYNDPGVTGYEWRNIVFTAASILGSRSFQWNAVAESVPFIPSGVVFNFDLNGATIETFAPPSSSGNVPNETIFYSIGVGGTLTSDVYSVGIWDFPGGAPSSAGISVSANWSIGSFFYQFSAEYRLLTGTAIGFRPRRVYPRNDGLAKGPRRVFPKPPSQQVTGRRAGGYL